MALATVTMEGYSKMGLIVSRYGSVKCPIGAKVASNALAEATAHYTCRELPLDLVPGYL